MELVVECRPGLPGDFVPERFVLGHYTVEVTEVIDQWYGPKSRYFKVLATDRCVYIIRRDQELGCWDLVVFRHFNSSRHGHLDLYATRGLPPSYSALTIS